MKKKTIFFLFAIYLFILCTGHIKSEKYYEVKKPTYPVSCFQENNSSNVFLCACTVGAMVLEYWGKVKTVKRKGCKGFQEEFKSKFKTSDGSSKDFKKMLGIMKDVANVNKKKDIKTFTGKELSLKKYEEIKNHFTYFQNNPKDSVSPYDRPGMLRYFQETVERKKNGKKRKVHILHVVLGYGISEKKEAVETITITVGGKKINKAITTVSYKFKIINGALTKRDWQYPWEISYLKGKKNHIKYYLKYGLSSLSVIWPEKCN